MPPVRAQWRQAITELICGDDFRVDRTLQGIPEDLEVNKAWFTVKDNETDVDVDAVVQLSITTTLTSHGQILDGGLVTTIASLRFTLADTQTLLLTPEQVYHWDIQVRLSDTGLYTPFKGTIQGQQQITIATS